MTTTSAIGATGTATVPDSARTRHPQAGPPLLLPVLSFAVLTIAYVVLNSSTPQPTATGADVLAYTQGNGTTIRIGAFLLLASAVPLAVLAGVLYRRLRALGITAPGSALTLVGGVMASLALTLSALFAWTGERLADDAAPALARAVADLSFLTGGVTYAVAFGLLVAGVAVTGLRAGLLPKPLARVGCVLAAAGLLATLSLLADPFGFALPVVRFGGLIWLVWVAAVLPRTRTRHSSA
ncbi:DUF4386 domain-containing protein [Streptomyces sp. NPDC021093]|uniref:DUF4386 domain-containing protein n=1 Tax=Streptomyces sp. NPDC021093 TaxID=3365112 RepID=UPI0037BD42C9